jgi:hypothetical protein
MDARELADQILCDKSYNLEDALLACIEDGSEIGLGLAIKLTDFDYDGTSYKWSDKFAAAITAIYWGSQGISKLSELALYSDSYSTITVITRVLAHAASSTLDDLFDKETFNLQKLAEKLDLTNSRYKSEGFTQTAKRELSNFVINFEPEVPVPYDLISSLNLLAIRGLQDQNTMAFYNLFFALTSRWFHLNKSGIENYYELIHEQGISEEDVQAYLTNNSYILDPFYAQVWPKAKLGEKLIVDFMVRLMDDTYIVVEIEKPSDPILTQRGDLSAQATHAIRQAIEYRDWLISNHLYVKGRFEGILRPVCLVVIGMESSLNEDQKLRLWQENESRHGILRVVGYDWLYTRSKSIFNNIVNNTLNRHSRIEG